MEREDIIKELEEILKSNLTDEEKREKLLQYHESDIGSAEKDQPDNGGYHYRDHPWDEGNRSDLW